MIYPKNFELKTGFNKIRDLVKYYCIGGLGQDKVNEMEFCNDFNKIKTQLNLAYEFKQICMFSKDFPQDSYFDVRQGLKRISIENTYLTIQELFDLKRCTYTLKNIVLFFKRAKDNEYPYLRQLCEGIIIEHEIFNAINNVMTDNGEIRDDASPELRKIRSDIKTKSASIASVVNRLLKSAKSQGWTDADAEVNIRDGKLLIPVSSASKRKISGIVVDESSTGKTSFIEPIESVELNNAVRELEFAEKREIIKILIATSDKIRPHIPDLLFSSNILGDLDFARAKARLALDMDADMPIIAQTPTIDMRVARHPILEKTLKAEGKKAVPLDIELNDKQRIIMISGPNAGGKSVCLKTTGLIQYMHQCGLLTPISPNSTLGLFNDIFIDIGDEQSIENDLSTYSGHLKNMKTFLEHAGNRSLILIDEFGTGTEPILGGAIAEAVLERLNERYVKGVITTHYTNLKNYATVTEGLINGAMLYDNTCMKPLFIMETGKTGHSFAFEMAKKTGLDIRILQKAEAIAGRDHIDYERRMQELDEDRRKLKITLENALNREKNLSKMQEQCASETEFTINERKNIIKATKLKAEEILKSANQKIENTIFEIKQASAEKEKTREIRKEYETFKEEITKQISEEERLLDEKIERLRQKQIDRAERRAKKREEKALEQAKLAQQKPIEKPLQPGDKVTLDDGENEMVILEIKDETALIQMGHMQTFVKVKRLKRVVKKEPDKKETPKVHVNIESEKKRGGFLFGLDVRGLRGDEALEKVAKYVDDALASGNHEIKILHGTGTGALRSMIRDYLNSQLIVSRCHDDKIELGGAGVTVVELDY
ncbi:MAG: Smr/MutS family protein [Bacteroidales bacterium]|nr:Smr/MutS family protein [Bacteroidales bacterium]